MKVNVAFIGDNKVLLDNLRIVHIDDFCLWAREENERVTNIKSGYNGE